MKSSFDELRMMLCKELDNISKQDSLNAQSLDYVKDITSSIKNIDKIKHMEKEEMEGYSQRNSYAQGGNSYARGGRNSYDQGMSNYYPYMGFNYARGYSRDGGKEEMIEEMRQLMQNAGDEYTRRTIMDCIEKLER